MAFSANHRETASRTKLLRGTRCRTTPPGRGADAECPPDPMTRSEGNEAGHSRAVVEATSEPGRAGFPPCSMGFPWTESAGKVWKIQEYVHWASPHAALSPYGTRPSKLIFQIPSLCHGKGAVSQAPSLKVFQTVGSFSIPGVSLRTLKKCLVIAPKIMVGQ